MLRKYDMELDPSNVVSITDTHIPDFVKFTVSLGPKFAYAPNEEAAEEIFLTLPKNIEQFAETANQVNLIRTKLKRIIKTNAERGKGRFHEALVFASKWMEETASFLTDNDHLLVTTADKGGKSVIIDKHLYQQKLCLHLSEFTSNGTYERLATNITFDTIRSSFEKEHKRIRDLINRYLRRDGAPEISFEPFIMARIALTIKVHKEGFPTRPIIAAPDRWNKSLSKWVLRILTVIARKYRSVKIENSVQLVNKLSSIGNIKNGHKLSTMDYTSMFTNVPYYVPREIVADEFYLVKDKTSVPVQVFLEVLDFIIDSSTCFFSGKDIYKQNKGLTMGNELSQVLADIATNKATVMTLASISSERVSFVYKYVDDFITAMDEEATHLFMSRMNRAIDGLSLVLTPESASKKITYLDMELRRNDDNSISLIWWQKECSKNTILSYFSNHPRPMKLNIMKQYMKHALSITSPEMYPLTMRKLTKVLRRSSYPAYLIRSVHWDILNEFGDVHVTSKTGSPDESINPDHEIMLRNQGQGHIKRAALDANDEHVRTREAVRKGKIKTNGSSRYVAIPFYDEYSHKRINDFIASNGIPVNLASSSICTNESRIFSSMKSAPSRACKKLAVFTLTCATCKERLHLSTGNLYLERYLIRINVADGKLPHDAYANNPVNDHMMKNPEHYVPLQPQEVKTCRNINEMEETLLRRRILTHRGNPGLDAR